jgi:hypothetical protein
VKAAVIGGGGDDEVVGPPVMAEAVAVQAQSIHLIGCAVIAPADEAAALADTAIEPERDGGTTT